MQVVKDNRAFDHPRERLEAFLRRGDLHFATGIHLCFVCGAADPQGDQQSSLRRQFLDWSEAQDARLVCVQAENAVTDLLRQVDERRSSKDLAVIEEAIADTVDSLLLFPESPGSFAELGLFSASEAISQKMLVAVQHQYQGDSFIILGPIKRINAKSSYSPQPIVVADDHLISFEQIRNRLLGDSRGESNYARRFAHGEWKTFSKRDQLALIDKIIDLCGVLTEQDLFDLINRCFGKYEKSDTRILVALLKAMGRVDRTGMGDIIRIVRFSAAPFVEGGATEAVEVKAAWKAAYEQHVPDAITELSSHNNELL